MNFDKKPGSDEVSVLESIGFSRHQARVYRELVALGPSTAGPIVRRTRLHRQFIYSALDDLETQGFVSHVIRNGRKVFSAARPETLLRRETERLRDLERIVPVLKNLANSSHEALHVDVIRGRDQFIRRLMQVVDSAVRGDGIIRAIADVRDTDIYEVVGDRYKEYSRYCRAQKIRKRFIVPKTSASSEYQERLMRERGATVRVLDSGMSIPTATVITSELVVMDLFGSEVVSIMIWNRTIAKSFLEHFAVMWKSAQPAEKRRRARR